jgi:hypothetical protein
VCADLGAFFQQANADVRIDLLEPDRRRQAGRPAANDNDIEFHGFALHGVFLADRKSR